MGDGADRCRGRRRVAEEGEAAKFQRQASSAFESFERAAGLRLKRPHIKKKSRPRRTAFEDTEIKCRKYPEQ